jgi:hypothetical protein
MHAGGSGEGKNFFANAGHEQLMIAAREIPAADAAAEKHIAAKKQAVAGEVKAQAARAVPRHLETREAEPGDLAVVGGSENPQSRKNPGSVTIGAVSAW